MIIFLANCFSFVIRKYIPLLIIIFVAGSAQIGRLAAVDIGDIVGWAVMQTVAAMLNRIT